MKKLIKIAISGILALYIGTLHITGQIIDRSVISSSYHTQDVLGEWVLGETIISDFRGNDQELNSGFLAGELRFMSTSVQRHQPYSLDAFPNPFSDQILVQHNFPGLVTIEFRDIHGRMLIRQKLISQNTIVPVSELPIGPYFLHYHSNALERGIFLVLKTK